jgi:hypothetical protein
MGRSVCGGSGQKIPTKAETFVNIVVLDSVMNDLR